VKNHINNKSELIIQDENDILHLINSSGQIEWSKKIEGQVLNEIHQIDSYKNGKLQFLFATKNKLYLVDRKGRNVGKFPLKFNDDITQPISVFDYDNNKNYRVLITQNNELFMFDSKGGRVRGFDYIKNEEIINSPKHFRISNKDLIVFKTRDDLKIINRRGRPRIETKTKFNFSSGNVFQFGNTIVTQTSKNEIIEIDLKGNTKIIDSYSSDMNFSSLKNIMVVNSGNTIFSKMNKSDLKFGKYSNLKIYNSDKFTLISIFDNQNKEAYLFDKDLNMFDDFPIKSESFINFRLNKNYFEFAFKTENKSIKFYKKSI
jgi:outer membrane protein assembly factor BamB